MLAEARPDLRTVHFHHTPFADPNALRALPSAAAGELLAGLAGYGACSFHTARWAGAFEACFADVELATFAGVDRPPPTFVAPLGPDPAAIVAEAASPGAARAAPALDRLVAGGHLIVRVDRVELSKNLLRGFWAFDELLARHGRWRGSVVFVALAYPSRQGLHEYRAYQDEVEAAVADINGRWATPDWTPIVLHVGDDYPRSLAALTRYDVLLVNPVRDGLNLVAKEGPLANTTDGVLALSRQAGAYAELAPAALALNPFDVGGTASVLHQALSLPAAERAALAAELRALVTARRPEDWLDDLLTAAR
jgi:trehalose 6-phosphate synthase